MSVPVELGREAAQDAAREELARQIYREAGPGLVERGFTWLLDKLFELLDAGAGVSPGGYGGLIVVTLLIVAAAVAVRLRLGAVGKRVASDQALFSGADLSSEAHRELADRHAAAGEWADAVRERMRAIVRSLEERSVLEPRPGRTASEAAREAGQAVPGHALDLRRAAHTFEDVWYGGRPATAESAAQLRELDRALTQARVVDG